MKRYDVKSCELLTAEEIAKGIFDFTVSCPEFAKLAKPGQFAHIYLPGRTLRRPISICDIDPEKGTLRFVFQIRGEGTKELAHFSSSMKLNILAPLGNGFPEAGFQKVLLVGGGIGVPPLLGVAARRKENAVAVLGFRDRNAVILEKDFQNSGVKTMVATDDGSYGFHGLVTELAEKEKFDAVFACGPLPMLKAVAALAETRQAPCFLSLEERMACGIGACLGCAVALRDEEGRQYYGHVCKDGPVFHSRRVVL